MSDPRFDRNTNPYRIQGPSREQQRLQEQQRRLLQEQQRQRQHQPGTVSITIEDAPVRQSPTNTGPEVDLEQDINRLPGLIGLQQYREQLISRQEWLIQQVIELGRNVEIRVPDPGHLLRPTTHLNALQNVGGISGISQDLITWIMGLEVTPSRIAPRLLPGRLTPGMSWPSQNYYGAYTVPRTITIVTIDPVLLRRATEVYGEARQGGIIQEQYKDQVPPKLKEVAEELVKVNAKMQEVDEKIRIGQSMTQSTQEERTGATENRILSPAEAYNIALRMTYESRQYNTQGIRNIDDKDWVQNVWQPVFEQLQPYMDAVRAYGDQNNRRENDFRRLGIER